MVKVDVFGKKNEELTGIGDTPEKMKNGDIVSIFRHKDGRLLKFGKNDFLQGRTTGYIGSEKNKENAKKAADKYGKENGRKSQEILKQRFGDERPYLLIPNKKNTNKFGYVGIEFSENKKWIARMKYQKASINIQKKFKSFKKAVLYRNELEIKYYNPILAKFGFPLYERINEKDIIVNENVIEAEREQALHLEEIRILKQEERIINYFNKGELEGVFFDKARNKWKATLIFNGKYVLNKRFNTKQEAIEARLAAEEKYFKPILEKYEKENPNE